VDLSRSLPLPYPIPAPWTCRELLTALLSMDGTRAVDGARALLEAAIKSFPEILAMGLAQVHNPNNALSVAALNVAMQAVLFSPSYAAPLTRLWLINHDLVIQAMADAHRLEPSAASRFLDMATELKVRTVWTVATLNGRVVPTRMLARRMS